MKKTFLAVVFSAALSLLFSQANASEKIKIATEGAYPPFNFVDSSGQLQGFDVDLARALCEKMKADCTIIAQNWDGILPGVLARKYDAVVASVTITKERQKIVSFSDPYYRVLPQFVVQKEKNIKEITPESMKGKTIGAQSATIHANYLAKYYKDSNIKLYATLDEANADLSSGRLDAVFADKFVLWDWLEKKGGKSCCTFIGDVIADKDVFGNGVGVVFRPTDTKLREAFNEALKQVIADGTYKKINDKYFPFSIR